MNLAREDAYRRMRSHGYRVDMQGVAMQRPHADGFNRPDAYVIHAKSLMCGHSAPIGQDPSLCWKVEPANICSQ